MKDFLWFLKWIAVAGLIIVLIVGINNYSISNQSKVSANQQRHLLDQLGSATVSYLQKHNSISASAQSPNGKIYTLDDFIKETVVNKNTKVSFTMNIKLTEYNKGVKGRTYTATASYDNKSDTYTPLKGEATSIRLQKGDYIEVSIYPTYEILFGSSYEEVTGKELYQSGKAHGYIKVKEG